MRFHLSKNSFQLFIKLGIQWNSFEILRCRKVSVFRCLNFQRKKENSTQNPSIFLIIRRKISIFNTIPQFSQKKEESLYAKFDLSIFFLKCFHKSSTSSLTILDRLPYYPFSSIRKRIQENLSTGFPRNSQKNISLSRSTKRPIETANNSIFLFFSHPKKLGCINRLSHSYFHCKLNAVPIKLQRQLVLSMLASTSSKRINHAIWVDQSRLTLPKWRLRNPETSISANPIRWIRRTYYCTLTVNFSSTRVGYTSILSPFALHDANRISIQAIRQGFILGDSRYYWSHIIARKFSRFRELWQRFEILQPQDGSKMLSKMLNIEREDLRWNG